MWWTHDGHRLLERGIAMLQRSSGELVESEWVSTIAVDARALRRFPRSGEVARISISPFEIDGSTMKYAWNGAIAAGRPYPIFDRPDGKPSQPDRPAG